LADNEAKPDAVKIPQEVAAKQDRNLEARAETKTEAGTSSQRLPNWIVQFSKPDHHVSPGLGQRKASLLRNTFVVWARRTFFVLATVANTIHTIQKIIVYWYRLLPTDNQNQFSKKKWIQIGARRAAAHNIRHWGAPGGRSRHCHAHGERAAIRVGSGHRHHAQWRRLVAAWSRSASARC
jgi:hypothetical protein